MSSHPINQYPTATERVAHALRNAIAQGAVAAGTPLRQEDIAAQHRVSRIPVREAFRQLEAEGLIVIYPGRGTFVALPDPAEVREIYDIRVVLEGEALRHAWPALTPEVLQHAAALLGQLEHERDSTTWSRLDQAFHTTLYTPAQRPYLLNLIAMLRQRVNHFFHVARSPVEYGASCQRDHWRILEACRDGEVERAIAALHLHLRTAGDVVVSYSHHLRDHME